jgi:hypothetical protein
MERAVSDPHIAPPRRAIYRRTLLKAGAAAALLAALPRAARAQDIDTSTIDLTANKYFRVNPQDLPNVDPFVTPQLRMLHWIPEKPASSALGDVWERLHKRAEANKPLTYRKVMLAMNGPSDNDGGDAVIPAAGAPPRNRLARSPNWSGAWVDAAGGSCLTAIAGAWISPSASRPDGVPDSRICRSSIWIGLDGQADYDNASLPQIGVSQDIQPGYAAQHWAWFEWWATPGNPRRKKPSRDTLPFYLRQDILNIQAHDDIICWIDILPANNDAPEHSIHMARMMIKNHTQGILVMPFYVFSPDLNEGIAHTDPRYPRVTGATAEWIVERPRKRKSADQFMMPNFADPLLFSSCVAGTSLQMAQAPTGERNLTVAQQIAMYQVPGGGSTTYEIAVPNRPTNTTSFSVQVRGS